MLNAIVQHVCHTWWRHPMETFPRHLPFVWGIHRSPVNSPHKGHCGGGLMFSFIYASTNSWANDGDAGDLRRHRAHYDAIVMIQVCEKILEAVKILCFFTADQFVQLQLHTHQIVNNVSVGWSMRNRFLLIVTTSYILWHNIWLE